MRQYMIELYRWRDLLFWLAAKEIKVRYKKPLLGFLWALLVPLCLTLTLWVVFTYVIRVRMVQYPFFLFLIVGIFPWNFFAQSVSAATTSIIDAGPLIKKTVFPRAIIPLATVAVNLFHFLCVLIVLIGVLAVTRHLVIRSLWLLPLAIGLELLFTVGMVLLVAVLQVRYRDVRYIVEIMLPLWFYFTPIFYPIDLVMQGPVVLQVVFLMNPFVYILELFRIALLGGTSATLLISPWLMAGVALVVSVGVFLLGFRLFRRHEPMFFEWVPG